MKDRNMPENEAFLTFVRDCLLQANTPQALGLSDEPIALSQEFHARMAPLLADPFGYAKRKTRPLWKKALRTAACVALAATLALGAAAAVSPALREWLIQQYHNSVNFYFSGSQHDAPDAAGQRPTYLPAGYQEVQCQIIARGLFMEFEDQEQTRLTFECIPVAEGYLFNMDNEHADLSLLMLNGQTAYLLESNTQGKPSYLVWMNEDGTLAYQITAHLSKEELMAMAQSVVTSG